MKIFDFEQYSDEWWKIRLGVATASKFDKIVTTKGEPSKSKTKLVYQLAGEFVSGQAEETYQNAAMIRGLEMEAEAREFYELINGVEVKQVGFCLDEGIGGASPDGLIEEDGNLEIKCPIASTHVAYLLSPNTLEKDYFQQVQGQMLITGRKWTDLMSYYPGIKPLIIRVERNEEFISKLRVELKMVAGDVKDIIEKIK